MTATSTHVKPQVMPSSGGEVLLLIGTDKGLFSATSSEGRSEWTVQGPTFSMQGVYGLGVTPAAGDSPPGRIYAGVDSSHFGPSLSYSDDLGTTWHEPVGSEHGPIAFPPGTTDGDKPASVERVWQIVPSPTEPGVVWAGTQPSALFKSTDGGDTFALIRGLWDHPHRPLWEAGFGGQAIHSILPHPDDPQRLLVAMSTGGVYRTEDGGETWSASNTGIKAYFIPGDQYPEFGQCVHKINRAAGRPETVYAQNHHGVYRSDDEGRVWTSIADGLPADFGFPIVGHPHRAATVYTYPLVADGERFPPSATMRVYRSDDAGRTWRAFAGGLAPAPSYSVVLRDAMCTDQNDVAGVYLGTKDGSVYASNDDGESFGVIAEHLPSVLNVKAVSLG